MAKRAISLNITIDATQAQMANENILRELCMQKMHDILDSNNSFQEFQDNVTIEVFDENVDEDTADAFASDFLVGKEYGL
ncbi:MAG: hypothetical protein EKK63_12300 [Acinetobacter sp.]|uniref:hypothetical protein n=1 Tax=Acinetobacter sp. TaxID=472 RepID=UPI000F9C90FC|nr:hypothetical protein [Acinetobacter sp.]RUP38445.1 MAG: hypothetical protein EKK63_12300 [Acinetobacter sp.]